MRTAILIAFAAVFIGCGTSAFADDSNMRSAPLVVTVKGPSDYPPDALKNKEEGIAIVAITVGTFGSKVWLVRSSGFDDLDRASMEIARNEKPTIPVEPGSDEFLVGVQWSLNPESLPNKETVPLGN